MSDAVILELIKTLATLATVIIGGIISVKLGKLHKQINSRMDQLIVETRSAAKAEGKIEEKAEQKERYQTHEDAIPDKLKITGEIKGEITKPKKP